MADDFYHYQQQTQITAVYPGQGTTLGLAYVMLGLCGETGGVAEHVKKSIRDDAGLLTADRVLKLKAELGDCLYYLARLCEEIGVELADVAAENLAKLADRKQRGVLRGSGSSR